MSSSLLMLPGIRSSLISSFGVSPLPLAFSLIFIVASKLLHPYSTDDKTSRLMVKQFPTARDTQRGSHSCMKKRRRRKEIEMTRRRSSEVKRGETNLVSNQFPKCSPQPGSPREIHRVK